MAGWQALQQHTDVNWTDFEPLSGSPTIGAGAPMAATSTDFNGSTFGNPADLGALADSGTAGSRPQQPLILSLRQ